MDTDYNLVDIFDAMEEVSSSLVLENRLAADTIGRQDTTDSGCTSL